MGQMFLVDWVDWVDLVIKLLNLSSGFPSPFLHNISKLSN